MITIQDAVAVLAFLESIGNADVGGTEDYELALEIMQDVVASKQDKPDAAE